MFANPMPGLDLFGICGKRKRKRNGLNMWKNFWECIKIIKVL
jgi:hypothetical protein